MIYIPLDQDVKELPLYFFETLCNLSNNPCKISMKMLRNEHVILKQIR